MRNLKTTKKAALSLLLAAILAMAVPMSANAATDEEASIEASTVSAEEVSAENSTAAYMEEELQDVSVHLTVQLQADKYGIVNRRNEIYCFEFGIYAAENITFRNDVYYRKNQEVGNAHTAAKEYHVPNYQDDCVYFSKSLPKGKYYLKLKTNDSRYYNANMSKKYYFTVEDSSEWYSSRQDIDLSENGTVFTATLVKQSISPKVIDKDTGKALADAKIEITGTDYENEKVVVYTGTSNSIGVFSNLPQLPAGKYEVRETKAPTGYRIDSSVQTFYVDKNHITDKAFDIRIYNEKKQTYIYGDIDGDGKITSNDALMINSYSVGKTSFSALQKKLADVDRDGNITSADSLDVLRYSVGLKSQNSLTGKRYIY